MSNTFLESLHKSTPHKYLNYFIFDKSKKS